MVKTGQHLLRVDSSMPTLLNHSFANPMVLQTQYPDVIHTNFSSRLAVLLKLDQQEQM
jgi:hypothetical protein